MTPPAAAWESELLPARVSDYQPNWLDELCAAGRLSWRRLRSAAAARGSGGSLRASPVVLLLRREAARWQLLAAGEADDEAALGSRAQRVAAYLDAHGASFFDEISDGVHLMATELEEALAELVMRGRACIVTVTPACARAAGAGFQAPSASVAATAAAVAAWHSRCRSLGAAAARGQRRRRGYRPPSCTARR